MGPPAAARFSEAGSRRSPSTTSTSQPSSARLSLDVRTTTRAAHPSFKSSRTRLAPTKPVPPVTNTSMAGPDLALRRHHTAELRGQVLAGGVGDGADDERRAPLAGGPGEDQRGLEIHGRRPRGAKTAGLVVGRRQHIPARQLGPPAPPRPP